MTDDRSVEEKISAIYNVHFPDKLGEIPDLMEKYAGKEKKLLKAIMAVKLKGKPAGQFVVL